MIRQIRVPLLFVGTSIAVALTLLFSAGVVLNGAVSALIWIALAAAQWALFRVEKLPLMSLSRVTLVFYLYPAVALLWPVLYPQINIAVRATGFQTPEVFAKANHLIAIGLAAFLAGWFLAFQLRAQRPKRHFREQMPISASGFAPLIFIALPLFILAFPTESIFTIGYNGAPREATLGAVLNINVFKPALYICLLLALVALLEGVTLWRKILWTTLFSTSVLVLGFATGSRVEEFGCLLAVGWIFQNRRSDRRFPKIAIATAPVLGMAMLILGEIRSVLPFQPLDSELIVDASARALHVIPTDDTSKMRPSTNGDVAATLCIVIGLIDTGVLQVDHGETFLNYIFMTLPRVVNPNRPIELQVFLQQLAMTGGGLYILAEPYLAGGAVGVFLVMGLCGLLIGTLDARFVHRELTAITFFLYLMLLSCVPRGILYSLFPLYKHVLTGVLILVAVRIASRLMQRSSGERHEMAVLQPGR